MLLTPQREQSPPLSTFPRRSSAISTARIRAVSCTRVTTTLIARRWNKASARSKAEQLRPPSLPVPEQRWPSFNHWHRAFDLGADLILHSTTKYFGGHCDVLGGIVVSKADDEFLQRIRAIQYEGGAVPSPFDCWLILRGMRTLPWRMRAHSENAMKVADFLSRHPKVARVHYPGLQSHPGHEIAAKQMSMFGGMLSLEVKDGRDVAISVAAKTKIFTRATSLGGVESLIEHRASIEGAGTTSPEGL